MYKKAVYTVLLLISVLLIFCNQKGLDVKQLPTKVTNEDLKTLYNESKVIDQIWGFSGKNLRNKDFSETSFELLFNMPFDNYTKWPSRHKLPEGFDPQKIFASGFDPGLSIKKIHEQGVTGKDISVAVIDKYINEKHDEFKGRMNYYPIKTDARSFQYRKHFHGIACAAILCGEKSGVAPNSILYYFATPDDNNAAYNYILAMEQLFKVNNTLGKSDKIRVVSISHNPFRENDSTIFKWNEIIERAVKENIIIVYSSPTPMHKVFTWGGCQPHLDKDDPENYHFSQMAIQYDRDYTNKIILPADFRTTGMNKKHNHYMYSGIGGFSWAIPYYAGLVALCLELDNAISETEIIDVIKQTQTTTATGKQVINPEKVINTIRAKNH